MNERITQKKNKREWVDTQTDTEDDAYIFKSLANELMAKYQYKASWVKSISHDYLYSGTQYKVTVTYDNGYRSVYILDK